MGYQTQQPTTRRVFGVAARQHGLITRQQLLWLGLSSQSIKHRVRRNRLHPVYRGVYAVGRPQLTTDGRLMAALLACGLGASVSHESSMAIRGLCPCPVEPEITISPARAVRVDGIRVHRSRALPPTQIEVVRGIATTDLLRTLTDLAPRWDETRLEDVIETADRRGLGDPERLHEELERRPSFPGSRILRPILERWTLTLTDTQLERRFLPIARRAGLGIPLTQHWLNGGRVDFFFPELGVVVEADGLRYHRTAARQTADARRDQRHAAAGLTPLRFSHAQITYHPDEVQGILRRVAARIRGG